jgi:MOSC domain-containing protein YiiM
MSTSLKELMNFIPPKGKVEWIGLRPAKWAELSAVNAVEIDIEEGLKEDHYSGKSRKRQVTLILKEHLEVVAKLLGKETIDPQLTRRNIVVSGINLTALKQKQFQIGGVILETTGDCHPCSRMEENLGPGGYNAMRGHGGITAKVIQGGQVKLGDEVVLLVQKG